MKKLKNKNEHLIESITMLLTAFVWNELVYLGARFITGSRRHYDMTTAFDRRIPFLPWTITIYFGCFVFWAINYYLCSKQEKDARDRFFCSDILSKTICFIIFICLPTTNIRPEITDGGIWNSLMQFLYNVDSADNLFPSIHCTVSWLCWVGIRKNKSIPLAYRYFSLIFAILVCISTLTTRQHVIADAISGILIAEFAYFVCAYPKMRKAYSAVISKLTGIFKK